MKGIWYDTILADPKTFNQLIAERDGSSAAILDNVLDCLVDYDMENKKWFSRLADFEIETRGDIRDEAGYRYVHKRTCNRVNEREPEHMLHIIGVRACIGVNRNREFLEYRSVIFETQREIYPERVKFRVVVRFKRKVYAP